MQHGLYVHVSMPCIPAVTPSAVSPSSKGCNDEHGPSKFMCLESRVEVDPVNFQLFHYRLLTCYWSLPQRLAYIRLKPRVKEA